MDIAKTKDLMQGKVVHICNHMRPYASVIIDKVKTAADATDKKSFIIGITAVFVIYLLMFCYVIFNSSATILKLESTLNSKIVAVDKIEKHEIVIESHSVAAEIQPLKIFNGLYEETSIGMLPIVRMPDQLSSFQAYSRTKDIKATDKPLVSFVIIDYGLSKEQSISALDLLPAEVTFSLSPYSSLPNEWVEMAHNKGHEIWLNMPIQQSNQVDSGSNTIFHHAPLRKKQKALHKTLSIAQGYAGVSSFTDKSSNSAKSDYLEVSGEVFTRGLGFLELNPHSKSPIEKRASYMGAPYIQADIKIIKTRGKNAFKELSDIAHNNGVAVAVIPNYPETIKNLAVWIMKVGQVDYSIVPISAIYNLQNGNKGAMSLHVNDHIEPKETTPDTTARH